MLLPLKKCFHLVCSSTEIIQLINAFGLKLIVSCIVLIFAVNNVYYFVVIVLLYFF